jgi:hypothetical protein
VRRRRGRRRIAPDLHQPRACPAVCALGRQRAELVAVTVGDAAIREIVRATPGIKVVAIVTGLGPLVPVAGGKKGREATKVYLKRHAFLSLYEE